MKENTEHIIDTSTFEGVAWGSERSRELILEEDRRYTLLRTKKWVERTKLYNHNGGQFVTNRDTLFPIPQVVIDANLTSKMEQNAGY